MPSQEWFRVVDIFSSLGFSDADSLRRWIRTGRQHGWLKVGTHIKLLNPKAKRPTWLVHFRNCNELGASQKFKG